MGGVKKLDRHLPKFQTLMVQWNAEIQTSSDFGQTFVQDQLVRTSEIRKNYLKTERFFASIGCLI